MIVTHNPLSLPLGPSPTNPTFSLSSILLPPLQFIPTSFACKMIQLLLMLIFSEMSIILMLLFKTKLVFMALDRLKRGRGPLMVKTIAFTLFVLLFSGAYTMLHIHKHANLTDPILMANHLLQTTLIGAVLFLGLMIDRLHHCIRELRIQRKSIEFVRKQTRGPEDGKAGKSEMTKTLEEETSKLRGEIERLKCEIESKTKDVDVAEGNVNALRRQTEGFLLEYDRLLEENQNLRSQLLFLDRRLSYSASYMNM